MAADPSSTSSCEILDLGLAATRDDATSKLFFSKGGDGDLSCPAPARVPSVLTDQDSLFALCDSYGVPREFKPVLADTLGCAACETPSPSPAEGQQGSTKALCVYSAALEAGLRFPMPVFYQKLLRHYRLAPSQLVPNAWRYMAAFVQRCKDAGVEPLVSAFRYFFSLHAYRHQDRPLGWHYFQFCVGRHRLFSGSLQTRFEWKKRFFFLQPPEGNPWKFPVAWGKPRMEDARTVELTNEAIDKLKLMPCVDLKSFLSLHETPAVGSLNLLQLHSTPAPMAKPESAAASAQALALTSLHQLHATLEAGARTTSATDAASEDDDTMRRKRRCSGLTPASVTMTPPLPQSFAISAVPPPQEMEMATCETTFDGDWGSSEVSMPPGICASDALFLYDAMVAMDAEKARLQDMLQAAEAEAAQQIAHLQGQLQIEKVANAKFMDYLLAVKAENAQLKEKYASEVAKLNKEHASEVAKLLEEHHKASAAHTEKVNSEHMAEIVKLQEKGAAEVAKLNQAHDAAVAGLMEEHSVDVARVKRAAEAAAANVVQDAKKDIALALFPDLDASLL